MSECVYTSVRTTPTSLRHSGWKMIEHTALLLCADADDFDAERGFAKDGDDQWQGEDEELLKVGGHLMHSDRREDPLISMASTALLTSDVESEPCRFCL